MKRKLIASGLPAGSERFNRALAEKLVDWMLSPNGIGALPIKTASREETLIELLGHQRNRRRGDCSELTWLAYGVFRLAGLKPKFIDVQRDAFNPSLNAHIAIGVSLNPENPGALTTIDLYHTEEARGWISDEGHLMQSAMPATSALAAYATNLAYYAMVEPGGIGNANTIEQLYQSAFSYDPYYPLTHYNYAFFLMGQKKDSAGACREAKKAEELRPFDSDFKSLARKFCDFPANSTDRKK